jgi:predicted nucleotidyltransferase
MTRSNILNTLREQKTYIQKTYEVDKIGLFGSYVNDTQKEDSDIDIYVEFNNKTFDNIAGLWNYLEVIYHKKIDLVYKHRNSNDVIFNRIQKEVIYG